MSERFKGPGYGPAERQMANALVEIEDRARRKANSVEDCDCKEGMFNGLSRRGLLSASVALAGGAFATRAKAEAPAGAFEYRVQEDPTEEQGC